MKNRPVYCDQCNGEIKVRSDLIVSNIFLETVPYHAECFGKTLNTKKTLFLSNEPLNGPFSTFAGIVCFICAVILLFSSNLRLYSIPLFLIAMIRLYVWTKYERHLEK